MPKFNKKRGPTPAWDSHKDGPVLPLEIFGVIIRHLAWIAGNLHQEYNDDIDPYKDLKACSLVCRPFMKLCRPYIFQTLDISFHNRGTDPPLPRFATLLKQKPMLAQHVKRLICHFDDPAIEAIKVSGLPVLFKLPNIEDFEIPPAFMDLSNDYTLYYTPNSNMLTFRKIVDHFINTQQLTRMAISNMWYPPLIEIFSSTTLRTLELRRCLMSEGERVSLPNDLIPANGFTLKRLLCDGVIDFPLSFLNCCPSLEEIEFGDVIAANEKPTPLLRSRPFPSFAKLRRLIAEGSLNWSDFCTWLSVAGVDVFPKLKDLRIKVSREEDLPGVKLLLQRIQSLETLHVYALTTDFRLLKFIPQSDAALKHLVLHYEASGSLDAEIILKDLCHSLALIAPCGVLEVFQFQIELFSVDLAEFDRRLTKYCKRMNDILIGSSSSRLRSVSLSFHVYDSSRRLGGSDINAEALQRVLDDSLGGLFSTKRFAFHRQVRIQGSVEGDYHRKNSVEV